MHRPDRPSPAREGARTLYRIIFESDTRLGRAFDLVLIVAIIASVMVVMLESVAEARERFGPALRAAEWFFTLLFTAEFLARLYVVRQPGRYLFSFFGMVDFFSIVPTYLSVLFPGAQYLLVVRLLRILRIFRILKLVHYLSEASVLLRALSASRAKITVFLFTVLTLVVIFGSLMYLIEGAQNGFTSIPRSVYWAIVTLTTVGYGDIAPKTALGQAVSALIMIMGYGIIAVPTGIVTVELSRAGQEEGAPETGAVLRRCARCGLTGHPADSRFCRRCGERIEGGAAGLP